MRIEQFTLKAQEALQAAQTLARRMGSPEVEPEHLGKALFTQEQGVAEALLRRIGSDPGLVQSRVDEALEQLPKIQGGAGASLSQRLLRDLDKAEDEAKKLKDEYVSSEHLLLALAQDKGAIGEALRSSGITRDRILTVLKDIRGGKRVTTQEAEDTYPRAGGPASGIPSSAATRRSAASSRCSAGERRTTRCSSAIPAWERPP